MTKFTYLYFFLAEYKTTAFIVFVVNCSIKLFQYNHISCKVQMRGFSVLLHLKPIFDFSEPEKHVFNNLHNNKKILKLTVHKKKNQSFAI